ncbi:unnamed protein product [Echinostoma caproni]|uniref:Uncharacterized protein n=1 Tax=Echinostoma caproni TaxID=27848 RepID=A0A183AQK7_9TREM|nr:unnamed protein product [Echinostoma caproni]
MTTRFCVIKIVSFYLQKCLSILEEAIRYADPLLTEHAFRGTTNNPVWSFAETKPIISLFEELHPTYSCPLAMDECMPTNEIGTLSERLFNLAPVTWEGYVVAPPGNIALEPKGIDRSSCMTETDRHSDAK